MSGGKRRKKAIEETQERAKARSSQEREKDEEKQLGRIVKDEDWEGRAGKLAGKRKESE